MSCTFPAAKLLRVRREISQATGIDVPHAAAMIDAIDQARWAHEEQTGCSCWYRALEEAAVAKHRAEAA